jgi:hypothetical protein
LLSCQIGVIVILQKVPKVFLSYSHDSEQHVDWVRRLAERLRKDGVDITLDQWDLMPGDDVTSFMEQSLSSCNYVLIVCTKQYVEKANTLKGGVGYERMIITTEIAQDLKSHRFIPVIRDSDDMVLPRFLGPRICLDFRSDNFDQVQYDILLRTLLGHPRHVKPPLGNNPYIMEMEEDAPHITDKNNPICISSKITPGPAIMPEESIKRYDPWCYHWHRSLHQYCGYKLYLIFLRFAAGSIIMRKSILANLRSAGVTNYMIFHLYSQWDVLIRAWADEETEAKLRNLLSENKDLHKDRQPEFLIVNEHIHFPNADTSPDSQRDVESILRNGGLASIQEVQEKGNASINFNRLCAAGLILDEKVGFDPDRIQFYITIRSLDSLEVAKINRLNALVAKSTNVYNRSIYVTGGSSIRAVVKAQASDYYDIDKFLQAITQELEDVDVMTETMLVANRAVRMSKKIDLSRASEHVIERELQEQVPELGPDSVLPYADRLMLRAKYVDMRERLGEDKNGILVNLIRAKASGSAEQVGKIILSIFPPLEEKLRQKLVPMIRNMYGNEWQKTIDDLKSSEGVMTKRVDNFVLGDLCKMYKRIVLNKRIIDIAPLSDDEFSAMMDLIPEIRNKFAHNAPDLKQWDSLFSFCSNFIPISRRLLNAIENIK